MGADTYFALDYLWICLIPFLLLVFWEFWIRRRPFWLVAPRLVWILALGFLVTDFTLIQSREFKTQGKLVVLTDESDSLAKIPERKERAQQILREIQEWSRANQQEVEYYNFGDGVRSTDHLSDLRGAYKSEMSLLDGLTLGDESRVVVITDGLLSSWPRASRPVFSIQVGRSDEKDIWIESAKPVLTAFLKNRLKIPLELGQKGFSGSEVKVSLWRGQERLSEHSADLESSLTAVELSYFPEKMGEELLRVEVEALNGELSELNNHSFIRVRTVRDKIRVLHICGRPDIDLKAWRLFLTRQPDVDLVSFYILRSLNDEPGARNSELSLIPFPYDELFSTELERFDVVILQNFNFNLYFQPFYLRNLADFILSGGALLIFGGDQSLQNYRGSPLDPLMPFRFIGDGDFIQAPLRAEATRSHPVIQGVENVFESMTWENRHRLATDPGSIDLVRFEDGTPLLSVRQIGEGRVVSWNTDESWKMHFEPRSNRAAFSRLARRILQYLTFDPEMEPIRVLSEAWRVGQKVSLRMSDGGPTSWKVYASYPRELLFESTELSKEIIFIPASPGLFEVEVDALDVPQFFETEEKPWYGEWKNLVSQDQKLKDFSERTGGKFFRFNEWKEIFDQGISGKQLIAAESLPWTRSHLWVSWIFLLSAIIFLCVDFYLRKKFQWDA